MMSHKNRSQATQVWILLQHLKEARASKKADFSASRSVSFIGSNGAFVSSFGTMEWFHLCRFLELMGISL